MSRLYALRTFLAFLNKRRQRSFLQGSGLLGKHSELYDEKNVVRMPEKIIKQNVSWVATDPFAKTRYTVTLLLKCGPSILDLGCDTGFFSCLLASKGKNVVAADIVGSNIDIARIVAQRTGTASRVRFVQCSAEHLPFVDGYFDGVLMREVVEHLPNLDRALQETKRVLKPGGGIVISTPNFPFEWIDKILRDDVEHLQIMLNTHVGERNYFTWRRLFSRFFEEVHIYGKTIIGVGNLKRSERIGLWDRLLAPFSVSIVIECKKAMPSTHA